ncbi:reverse transcriptase domain-containing protein [Tanacetum coccineum]|uniref:Reverse transcriptase domain-containing protein n=1 Tax=Tanacetum coccineum TaxID=301880 RepID=A0ABQ4WE31_9ASTR
MSGRMLKWKFELEGYDIQYRQGQKTSGAGGVGNKMQLSQILADFIVERPEEESPNENSWQNRKNYRSRGLCFKEVRLCRRLRAGLYITQSVGLESIRMRFRFEVLNNEAEYEALIAVSDHKTMGVKNLQAHVDSRLVANQVNSSYIAKEPGMIQYLNKVLVEELKEKSINEKEILDVVEEEGNTWMTPICEYLAKEILPEDKKKARAVRRKASRRVVQHALDPGLWLPKVFEKDIWATRHMDAREFDKGLHDCSNNTCPVPRNPQQNLTPITSPWPFYKWGIDIDGPFSEGPGKIGLPGEIISDNGKQFHDNPFKDWCEKLRIRQCFASVKHPQANGLVERANRSLGEGIKARLDERSKDWIEELPHVLWAHREDLTKNNEALGMNLDLIAERREQAAIQEAKSKKKMEKYYNSRVRGTSFKPGDMVYRSNEASHARDEGKLGPKWEGPYEVKESLGKEAYKLKDCKGNEIPRTWNICNLQKELYTMKCKESARHGDAQEWQYLYLFSSCNILNFNEK